MILWSNYDISGLYGVEIRVRNLSQVLKCIKGWHYTMTGLIAI